MRPKTLFRTLVKAIGVWLIVASVADIIDTMMWFPLIVFENGFDSDTFLYLGLYGGGSPVASIFKFVLGLYLFFGGGLVIRLAFPDNRLYCRQCGYEIRGALPDRCPECDTPVDDPTSHGRT